MLYRKCDELETKLSRLSSSALAASQDGNEVDQEESFSVVAMQDIVEVDSQGRMSVYNQVTRLFTHIDHHYLIPF